MNILLIGLSSNNELRKVLLANGFMLREERKFPSRIEGAFDLIAVAVKSSAGIKDLQKLREAQPNAWVALVVKKECFNDTDFSQRVLEAGHHDLWFEDNWQTMFWHGMKRAIQNHQSLSELKELKRECQLLRSQTQDLSGISKQLISRFEKNVTLASNIQRLLITRATPSIPGVAIAVKYVPSTGMGGDYYDIFEFTDKNRFGVLLVDSKTHGMAAMLLSVLLKVRLEEMKERFPDSKSFVQFLNHEIQLVNMQELSTLNLLYGIFDRTLLTFQYTAAGRLAPLLWRHGEFTPIQAPPNPPLGGVDQFEFREHFVSLKPKDLLLFHTDGLDRTLAPDGRAPEKIGALLKQLDPLPDPLDVQNELMALVDRAVEGTELQDDITLIQLSIAERVIYVAAQNTSQSHDI